MVRSESSKVCLTEWMAGAAVFFVDAVGQTAKQEYFRGKRGGSEAGSTRGVRNGSRLCPKRTFPPKVAIIFSLLSLLLFSPGVRAQKSDWHRVEMLEPGSWLHVKAQRKYFCVLEGVANDQLVCEVHKRRSFRTTTIWIPRAEVREVRKVPNLDDQQRDGWIGAGVGAAAGAITAGSTTRTYRGANAALGGLGGAVFGFIAGQSVPLFQMHGRLIYKR